MLKFSKAFTLAEVMIVMAIIGVTAMMAIPALNGNMEEKKVVSALRKIYPELETSYTAMVKDYGRPIEWNVSADATTADMNALLKDYISRYMNVLKDCGTGAGCFTSSSAIDSSEDYVKFLLKDGSSVAFSIPAMSVLRSNMQDANNDSYACQGCMGGIVVDVNGPKGENQEDYDIFKFSLCYSNGVVPFGIKNIGNGYTTGWVLKVGNRDYLKCDDLNWDTKRTCK